MIKPSVAWLTVNRKCNFRCQWCYAEGTKYGPEDDMSITWYDGLFAKDALQIVCFPYAQHFVSDSPGHSSFIKSKEELALAVKAIDFDKIKVFSTKSFKIMFLIGALVSFFITLSLVLVLIFTNLN